MKNVKKFKHFQKISTYLEKKSKHSEKSLNIPKKSKQNTLLWVATPPGGKPPRKTYLFLNERLRKIQFLVSRQRFF